MSSIRLNDSDLVSAFGQRWFETWLHQDNAWQGKEGDNRGGNGKQPILILALKIQDSSKTHSFSKTKKCGDPTTKWSLILWGRYNIYNLPFVLFCYLGILLNQVKGLL